MKVKYIAHITNSGHNFPPRYSNNLRVLKAKVLKPRKEKLINPDTNSWVAVLEPHDKVKPPNIETHSLNTSIHGNNSLLN